MIYQLWWSGTALVVVIDPAPKRVHLEDLLRQVTRAHGGSGTVCWAPVSPTVANPALARVSQALQLEVPEHSVSLVPDGVQVFDRPMPDPHVGQPALLWTGSSAPISVVVLSGDPAAGYETAPSCTNGCRVPHNCLFPVSAEPLLHRALALAGE